MQISFRVAAHEDSENIWTWRNDPITRAHALKGDLISWQDHSAWFEKKISDSENCKIYIAHEKNTPCAMLRFDRRDPELWELSWNVAPKFRGRGLGKALLKDGVKLHPWNLLARIKEANVASVKIAEAAGFRISGVDEGIVSMSYRASK